jgi:hypothetical protein
MQIWTLMAKKLLWLQWIQMMNATTVARRVIMVPRTVPNPRNEEASGARGTVVVARTASALRMEAEVQWQV